MKCKGCGIESLSDEGMTMVADWPFCSPCFEKLLTGGDRAVSARDTEESAGASQEAQEVHGGAGDKKVPGCELCGAPLGEDDCRVGIWKFCRICFQDLVMAPSPPRPVQGEDSEEAEEDGGSREDAFFVPDHMKSVLCAGCGRSIPLGGAKPVEEKCYCPDCFLLLPPERAIQGPALAQKDERSSHGTSSASETEVCEACLRRLPLRRLQEVQGFEICSACLATDEAMALELARSHHRKRMEAERRQV
ncbi:hypothetical protein LZ24_02898 [Desulfobotulus alkaliphilus]|uniref:Uncharacterized protein n=1 Tax=Desulfobotulus alkaliphilus TaxID=622671 RepID=A0A562RCA6_9BACT|nr:hypothetical protein [Desulfobotulus alkaliphilus]TWI66675.1 hypothetical protein LZ24_02898 [Desulfobotulus alkaliphilus]